jgi:hypothetical protein
MMALSKWFSCGAEASEKDEGLAVSLADKVILSSAT